MDAIPEVNSGMFWDSKNLLSNQFRRVMGRVPHFHMVYIHHKNYFKKNDSKINMTLSKKNKNRL
jgi:hypothetical protein